jgi:hypothetical protein
VEEYRKATPQAPIPFEARKGRTANPVQTTRFLGVKKGFRVEGVDWGNPLYGRRSFKGGSSDSLASHGKP